MKIDERKPILISSKSSRKGNKGHTHESSDTFYVDPLNTKFKENNEFSNSSDDYLGKDRIKIVSRNTKLAIENPK